MKRSFLQKTGIKNRHRQCHALFFIFIAAVFLTTHHVQAAYLGLMLDDRPDILSDKISFHYDYNAANMTGTFTANGKTLALKTPEPPDGPGNQIAIFTEAGGKYSFGGTFYIDAAFGIDFHGNPHIIDGSLTIGGTILPGMVNPDLWDPDFAGSGTLLSGKLTNFGFDPTAGGSFEFLFSELGGDLAPYFHGLEAGVIMGSYSFPGNFQEDFIGSKTRADTAPYLVPIPATILIMFTGIPGILLFRK